MFATMLYYTAGHAGIQVFGDIGLCIPIWDASRVDELGTYQAKHGMMPQTRYAFSTEPNRTMKVGVSVSTVRFHPTIKIVVFPLTFYKNTHKININMSNGHAEYAKPKSNACKHDSDSNLFLFIALKVRRLYVWRHI